jgi:hypothetical protein
MVGHQLVDLGAVDRHHHRVDRGGGFLDRAALANIAADAAGEELQNDSIEIAAIRVLIERFARRRTVRELAPRVDPRSAALWRRVRRRVERAVDSAALGERTSRAPAWSRALGELAATPGLGAQRIVAALDRQLRDDAEFADAVQRAVHEWRSSAPAHVESRTVESAQIDALLLICPDA